MSTMTDGCRRHGGIETEEEEEGAGRHSATLAETDEDTVVMIVDTVEEAEEGTVDRSGDSVSIDLFCVWGLSGWREGVKDQ